MARNDIPVRLGGIPSQYKDGLAKLRRLGDESIKELSSALKEVPPTMNSSAMTSTLSPKISTIPQNDIKDIVSALLSLSSLQADLDVSTSSVAESISRAMEESDSDTLRLPSADRERFKERVIQLLDSPSLQVAGKARNLLFEHEHVFQEARIVTDIRPVFGANLQDAPEGAMVIHMLKLSYIDDGQIKNIFVELDTRDISILRDLLDRADSKAESLKAVLGKTDVAYIDVRAREGDEGDKNVEEG